MVRELLLTLHLKDLSWALPAQPGEARLMASTKLVSHSHKDCSMFRHACAGRGGKEPARRTVRAEPDSAGCARGLWRRLPRDADGQGEMPASMQLSCFLGMAQRPCSHHPWLLTPAKLVGMEVCTCLQEALPAELMESYRQEE